MFKFYNKFQRFYYTAEECNAAKARLLILNRQLNAARANKDKHLLRSLEKQISTQKSIIAQS